MPSKPELDNPGDQPVSLETEKPKPVLQINGLNVHYRNGSLWAIGDLSMDVVPEEITAIIGSSGCGKSSVLLAINRMLDFVPTATVTGQILYRGLDVYEPKVDPVEVRKRIGMVFQKANLLPKSVYDNTAFGIQANYMAKNKIDLDERVEKALRRAQIWGDVKDRLHTPALALSGGQQQRVCIARALAVEPDILLMDEPCSALDPIFTYRIEELMLQLKKEVPILIVTHNMQQASRIADRTGFITKLEEDGPNGPGRLLEFGPSGQIFDNPRHKETQLFIEGKTG